MTRVRIVGKENYNLRYELITSPTSREALSTYDVLETDLENTVEVETASIGSALALLEDIDWYLTRYADFVNILEPSVSEDEWLSRELARELYERDIDPEETDEFYAVRGLEDGNVLEAMYVRGEPAEYDLHDVDEVIVTRISEDEF